MIEDNFGIEAFGMLEESLHELRTLYAISVGGPVIYVGGGHELATLGKPGDKHGFEVGAGGVDRRTVAGRPGTQDENTAVFWSLNHDDEGK
jgi:hypothetical protein